MRASRESVTLRASASLGMRPDLYVGVRVIWSIQDRTRHKCLLSLSALPKVVTCSRHAVNGLSAHYVATSHDLTRCYRVA
jgi:hypothetical protein